MSRPAFLLKQEVNPNVFLTVAGMRVVEEDIDDGVITVVGMGIFVGSEAENRIVHHALNKVSRRFELSYESGRRIRAKFRVAGMTYRGDFNGERNYSVRLESVGEVETVQ